MKRNLVIAGIVVILFLAVGLGVKQHSKGTPQYAIRQLAAAMKNQDRETFEKYLDVDRTVESMVDDLMDKAMAELERAKAAGNPFAAFSFALGESMIDELKPELIEQARSELLAVVDPDANTTDASDSDPLFEGAEHASDIRFGGFASIETNGNESTVGINLRFETLDTSMVAVLDMERAEAGHWRVVGIQEIDKLADELLEVERRRLAEVNAPIEEEINSLFEVGEATTSRVADWFSVRLRMRVPVKNVSSSDLRNIKLKIAPADDLSSGLGFPTLESLGAGEEAVIAGNLTESASYTLYNAVSKGDTSAYVFRVHSVDVKRGDKWVTLEPYSSWDAYMKQKSGGDKK